MDETKKDSGEYRQGFLEGYSKGIRDGYRDLRASIRMDILSGDFDIDDYIYGDD